MSKKLRRHQTVIVEIASTSAYVMRRCGCPSPRQFQAVLVLLKFSSKDVLDGCRNMIVLF